MPQSVSFICGDASSEKTKGISKFKLISLLIKQHWKSATWQSPGWVVIGFLGTKGINTFSFDTYPFKGLVILLSSCELWKKTMHWEIHGINTVSLIILTIWFWLYFFLWKIHLITTFLGDKQINMFIFCLFFYFRVNMLSPCGREFSYFTKVFWKMEASGIISHIQASQSNIWW